MPASNLPLPPSAYLLTYLLSAFIKPHNQQDMSSPLFGDRLKKHHVAENVKKLGIFQAGCQEELTEIDANDSIIKCSMCHACVMTAFYQ